MNAGDLYCLHDYDGGDGVHDAFVHCCRTGPGKVRVRIFYDYMGQVLHDEDGMLSLSNKLPFTFKGNLGTVFSCGRQDLWLTGVPNIAVARAVTKDDFATAERILCRAGKMAQTSPQ